MPELPEVETIRRDLEKEILGARILDVWTDTPKMIQPSVEVVRKAAIGSKIKAMKRRAKLLIFKLSYSSCHSEPVRPGRIEAKNLSQSQGILRRSASQDDDYLYFLIHLKLSGRLLLRKATDPADDWQRIVLKLKMPDGEEKELRFSDLRKFGYLKLVDEEKFQEIYQEYGPEPLDDLTLERFREILSKSRIAIKKLLMDQKRISGIGNIYANEALWMAEISPQQPANSLTAEQSGRLFEAVEKVLAGSLEYRGTTAEDDFYLDAYGRQGRFQSQLLVYRKAGQPCPRCGTPIERIEVGGRGTFFCPTCQCDFIQTFKHPNI